jgi:hypothetical protein
LYKIKTETIMIKLLTVFILLTIYASQSWATIYKCTDPVTQKVNFTDKPCDQGEITKEIDKKNNGKSEHNGKELQQLLSELESVDNALDIAKFYLDAPTRAESNRPIPHPEAKRLASEHFDWYRARKVNCSKLHSIDRLPSKHNEKLIACQLDLGRERIALFMAHPLPDRVLKEFKKALSTSNIEKNEHKVTIIAKGKEGLLKGVRDGILKISSQTDLENWKKTSGLKVLPQSFNYQDKYLVTSLIKLSGGLGGANSAIFLVPDQTLMPSGDYGHSLILMMDNGSCVGVACSILR